MKSTILKISNYALYLLMCATLSAGLVLEYRLPTGRTSQGLGLLSLSRHDWREIHFALAATLGTFVLVHLALNWSWVKKVAARGNLPLLLLSVGLGLALIIWPFLLPVEELSPLR